MLLPFPFSDLSNAKLRPAVVLAEAGRGDWILRQVTSSPYGDPGAIPLAEAEFKQGGLSHQSFARPGKLFTASSDLILRQVGVLKAEAIQRVVRAVIELLRQALGVIAE